MSANGTKRAPANSGQTVVPMMPEGRRFQPGRSGNPRGRPKRDHDIAELARTHTVGAIATLAAIMTDPGVPPSARVNAAIALLDRGWGKPPQYGSLEVSHTLADEFEALIRELGRNRPATLDHGQEKQRQR